MQSALQHRRLKHSIKIPQHDPKPALEKPPSSESTLVQPQQSEQQGPPDVEQDANEKKGEVEEEKDPYNVDFDGERDPQHPRNWSWPYKLLCTFLIFNLVFVTGWASAADSSALYRASTGFHVSAYSETLATAVYLFAVGTGAVFAGPISEIAGRNPAYFISGMIYLLALLGSGAAQNFAMQILMRFLAGLFASPAMSCFGGSLADMYDDNDRALIWPVFSMAPLLGPLMAPIASGWIVQSDLCWQWVEWLTLIISSAAFLAAFVFLPETFTDMLLTWKAYILRKQTGNPEYHAEHERGASLLARIGRQLNRMYIFLIREPITIMFGLYMTLLYILVFTFLHGFHYIYTKPYGFTPGQTSSAFASVVVGVLAGVPYVMLVNSLHLRHLHKTSPPDTTEPPTPTPESRLLPAIPTAVLLPLSLFWLAFTNFSSISFFSSLSACCLFGFALSTIFTPTYHYLLDAYGTSASSAMSAVTTMRYFAAGGMVLATVPMYEKLHVRYVMVLLGSVSAVMVPVPALFWWKGVEIREKSRFARMA